MGCVWRVLVRRVHKGAVRDSVKGHEGEHVLGSVGGVCVERAFVGRGFMR